MMDLLLTDVIFIYPVKFFGGPDAVREAVVKKGIHLLILSYGNARGCGDPVLNRVIDQDALTYCPDPHIPVPVDDHVPDIIEISGIYLGWKGNERGDIAGRIIAVEMFVIVQIISMVPA